MNHRKGFTILELLVVIAIIMIGSKADAAAARQISRWHASP